mmetsp:Transcript_12201/g.22512  ORF Transcript_12201/g.22512 Transcript_12201/m.22512 type:complete len:506 (+) Transcript_12201:138-1655(+)
MATATNSAVSMLRLWDLCLQAQDGVGGSESGVVYWSTLRQALLNGLGGRVQQLQCSSVDDLLVRHFCGGVSNSNGDGVNFMHYWRGMEVILQACSAFQTGGLDAETEEKVDSLRMFRDAVLDETATHLQSYPLQSLRALYSRLTRAPGTSVAVVEFWEMRMSQMLPPGEGDDGMVFWDEIASALLAWLQELLQDFREHAALAPSVYSTVASTRTPGPSGVTSTAGEDDMWQDTYMLEELGPDHPLGVQRSNGGANRFGQWPSQPSQPSIAQPWMKGPTNSSSSSRSKSALSSTALPPWLTTASTEEEAADVHRFRHGLLQHIGDGELTLSRLYLAVRDVVRDRALVHERKRAAVILLTKAVTHLIDNEVRGAFRQMQSTGWHRKGPQVQSSSILVDVVCSQAETAKMLEKRANHIPWAYHMAWLLGRMRYQRLSSSLGQWRKVLVQSEAAQARSSTALASDRLAGPRLAAHPTSPAPGASARQGAVSARGRQQSAGAGVQHLYDF